ncbi:M20/M25/M40 family metallo-hydrolase [uncultured Limosilactobacillus sp.]|uniref:M20/M25/M40 family metallo-hydrolase n=1 Tax=uncultured Limosilactobacillus sp. TaxID=2837629 RepID=UPI0025CEA9B2|nr:M20/M25/M40 family metallo-hydrolase [uncultured Limosilactobacillus sp.]
MTEERRAVEQYALDHWTDFKEYLEHPSISAQNTGIQETSDYLVQTFKDLGATNVEKWKDQGGNPVVFAEFKGTADRTVLFYNHYDVQPPEPLTEWRSDPFKPTVNGNHLVARGVCDDKGELMARLGVVKYFQEHDGLPVNLKFFVEGEEETGSQHVEQYVKAHKNQLNADACIWEGGGKNSADHFEVIAGVRGIVSFDIKVKTADADIHSSLANYVPNAAWRLVEGLGSLRDPKNGRITVGGFYDDISPLTTGEKAAVKQMDFAQSTVKEAYGLKQPLITNHPREEIVNGTTLTINGLSSGYEGKGVKTIVPREARAKLDCRLAPNQAPKDIMDKLKQQLKANGYGDFEVKLNVAEDAWRTPMDDPFVQAALQTARVVYGPTTKYVPNTAGGGPVRPFGELLGLPVVMVGVHYAKSGPHAPNEHLRLSDYAEGSYYLVKLLTELG